MVVKKESKRVRIPKIDVKGESILVDGKTVYLRTAIQLIMGTLKKLENKGIIESLSVQKNLINTSSQTPKDFVSFKIKKWVI